MSENENETVKEDSVVKVPVEEAEPAPAAAQVEESVPAPAAEAQPAAAPVEEQSAAAAPAPAEEKPARVERAETASPVFQDPAKLQELKNKIVKTLATMFDYLGLSGSFRVDAKGNKLAVKITSDDAGRVIGRKGQTLDSLQLVLNRIMFKDMEDCPRLLLDIDGYAKGEREPKERRDGGEREPREPREHRDDRG